MEVYLQLATRQAQAMAEGVAGTVPDAWQRMLKGDRLSDADKMQLAAAFAKEQREAHINTLKVYNTERLTVYATEEKEIGAVEDKPALRNALSLGLGSVLIEQDVVQGAAYEVYVPYRYEDRVSAVFELYEPVSNLDSLLWRVSRPAVLIPSALLLSMLGALAWLVGRAQSDIDRRTSIIVDLRNRLEKLVSRRAVASLQTRSGKNIPSEAVELTLYYSDIRNFTAFSEGRPPTEVIAFLNRIIGLQVEILESHGGDVDKIIGDAVLARFEGEARARSAVGAAFAIQDAITTEGFECGIGIGLFSGPVVAGTIGVADRLDYTVVGDSVNVAARLCSLAEAGEIIADIKTIDDAGIGEFGRTQSVSIKGRKREVEVRKSQPDAGVALVDRLHKAQRDTPIY